MKHSVGIFIISECVPSEFAFSHGPGAHLLHGT